jgi:hypothetical protein
MTLIGSARRGIDSKEVAIALAMFGLASRALLKERECELCYRIAFPGLTRCRFHTRAKVVEYGRVVQDARTARMIFEATTAIRAEAASVRYRRSRERRLAGAIFRLPIEASDVWHFNVQMALRKSPLVERLIGQPAELLEPIDLLRELRQVIDPDELEVGVWPRKILWAQRWLEFAEAVAPGAPPKGARLPTKERLRTAEVLLKSGMTAAQVAEKLKITRTNLYQILHRHGRKGESPPVRRRSPRTG